MEGSKRTEGLLRSRSAHEAPIYLKACETHEKKSSSIATEQSSH